ncbi:MAG: hypothetical protein AABO57_01300 [Acidobacteriota bacterium]
MSKLTPRNSKADLAVTKRTAIAKLEEGGNALFTRMQTRKARRGMKTAFNASPAQLGRAAVKAARENR